jgi:hypothetical protein
MRHLFAVQHWRAPIGLARWAKLLLCALTVFGVMPGATEIVETVAHLVHDGHLPHGDAHEAGLSAEAHAPCGDEEHDCSTLFHTCHCCHTQSVVPTSPQRAPQVLPDTATARVRWPTSDDVGPERANAPPVPPPNAVGPA